VEVEVSGYGSIETPPLYLRQNSDVRQMHAAHTSDVVAEECIAHAVDLVPRPNWHVWERIMSLKITKGATSVFMTSCEKYSISRLDYVYDHVE